MNEEQLSAWCNWFWKPNTHVCDCGWWANGGARPDSDGRICPVLRDGNPIYVPEPVRGNPIGKNLVFLAINPGGGHRPSSQNDQSSCPWWNGDKHEAGGGWLNTLDSDEHFAYHHIHGNELAAIGDAPWTGYEHDYVTRVAVGVIASLRGEVTPPAAVEMGSHLWKRFLPGVAIINAAHCKSPSWVADGAAILHHPDRCGSKTWSLFSMLRPRRVIAFGKDVRVWYHMHSKRELPDEGTRTIHRWSRDTKPTVFYWAPHPRKTSHEHTCAVISTWCRSIGRQRHQ